MAVGYSTYTADAVLDALFNNTSLAVTNAYIQLHTADPGSAGTANVAGNATRKAVSFGAASSAAIANDADISWTTGEVDTSEDYTHFTLWDASSLGNFLWSGTITADPVTAGNTFTILTGDLDLSMTPAS